MKCRGAFGEQFTARLPRPRRARGDQWLDGSARGNPSEANAVHDEPLGMVRGSASAAGVDRNPGSVGDRGVAGGLRNASTPISEFRFNRDDATG